MERHVVIGTAGHVDHGKTALVRALTGTDTDRWAEEKRRGITIDLGFAALELGPDLSASIVDVPGHEDFVRNMVAGATGIDVALMVVAADEGVMPQTTEHLAILEFLEVRTGVAIITKCDLVDTEWLELVRDDLKERLDSSSVAWGPIVIGSAETGQGLNDLKQALAQAATASIARSQEDLFRLPVDRVFSIAGAGTVVTGTVWSGSVSVGSEVRVLPGDHSARVRGVEVHGATYDAALPGRRTALALVGLDRTDVRRGHVVVSSGCWRETNAIDVIVTLLPSARRLTQRSRIRFHLGTAEVMARVTPLEAEILPGSRGPARLRLEAPLVCRWGDRGVLRSYSPVTTVGGCVVVDPWPPGRPRRPVAPFERANDDRAKRLTTFVECAGADGVGLDELPVRVGLLSQDVEDLVAATPGVVRAGRQLVSPQVITEARDATIRAVTEYHRHNPLASGLSRELARRVVRDVELADFVQRELADAGVIALEGQVVRLAEFAPELDGKQREAGQRLLRELEAAGKLGKTAAELAQLLPDQNATELAEFYVRHGTAVRVGRDRYYHKEALDRLLLEILGGLSRRGTATPGQLREETGLSRKYLIPLLEWMDGNSLTVRRGDERALGPAAQTLLESVDTG
ncbi:MAG: selenocysteine-specific translation elongation factor [Gemmatimonadota bacterium]|nr:MAG: selenocysteine-specific translation elongation factor [Gemmatimonadota bacterium]